MCFSGPGFLLQRSLLPFWDAVTNKKFKLLWLPRSPLQELSWWQVPFRFLTGVHEKTRSLMLWAEAIEDGACGKARKLAGGLAEPEGSGAVGAHVKQGSIPTNLPKIW